MITNLDNVARFFQFMAERQKIYNARLDWQPWPWTDDKILQTYKFTNVFRQNDTGTIWLTNNWLRPYGDHPMLFFNIGLYRQFNYIPTAELLGFQTEWKPDDVFEKLEAVKIAGKDHLFTNAHMVRGPQKRDGTKDKLHYMVYKVLTDFYNQLSDYEPLPNSTLQASFQRLLKAYGFGSFVSYEVITDCRHTRYLENAPDIMTWANAGPGAMRGMNFILELPVNRTKSQVYYNSVMLELLALSKDYLPADFPKLEMRDIEHTLCEFFKYEKVRLGLGRPRMKFVPPMRANG